MIPYRVKLVFWHQNKRVTEFEYLTEQENMTMLLDEALGLKNFNKADYVCIEMERVYEYRNHRQT